MGLYDMNKQIIEQLPTLTDFEQHIKDINAFVRNNNSIHFLLYGKEISYFTLFQRSAYETEDFGKAVIECLTNVGEIKAIDLTENADAFEIWVIYDSQATCLYLFPYDSGIVKVGL